MKRHGLGLLLLLLAGAANAAIEPPVLRASLETEPVNLDWNDFRTPADRFVLSFLMRGLLKYDAGFSPVCDLCTAYHVSPDGKRITFELNPAESWSDGVKLEAKHFVDSFKRLQLPSNRFRAAANFREVLSTRAEGKNSFQLLLSRASPTILHELTTVPAFPIRKELIKPGPAPLLEHLQTAVLGPYLLAEWKKGKSLVIEGNPEFKGPRPVYRVVFNLGRHSEQILMFQRGKLDILPNPTTEDLMRVPGQRVQVNPYWATRFLLLNTRGPVISKPSFRRALVHALDRQSLPAFLRNGERPVTGLIPPGLEGYRDLPLVTPDLTRAQAERAQAVSAGQEIVLNLLMRETETDKRVAQWLSDQLARIQVKLRPFAKNPKDYSVELEAGRFDLALSVWSFETSSPLEILREFRSGAPGNRGSWANVAYDELLDRSAEKMSGRASLLDQASQILEAKEVGVIPLGYPTQPFLLGPRVNAFAITPFGDPDLIKIQLKQ